MKEGLLAGAESVGGAGGDGDAKRVPADESSLSGTFVGLTAAGLYADWVLTTVVVPILPPLLSVQGIPNAAIFGLFASKALVQVIANPSIGAIIDKRGPLKPVLCSLAVLFASTLAFAFSLTLNARGSLDGWPLYTALLFSRAIQGVSSCAVMSGGMASIAMTTPEKKRGEAMGNAMAGVALGVMSGPSLGGLIAQYFGNAAPFFIIACIVALAAVLQLRVSMTHGSKLSAMDADQASKTVNLQSLGNASIYDTEDESPPRAPPGVCSLLSDEFVLMVGLASIVTNSLIALLEPLTPLFMEQRFGITNKADIGLIFGVCTLGYLVGTPLVGALADRCSKWALIGAGMVTLGVVMMLYMQCAAMWQVYCCLACVGLSMAAVDVPVLPLLADIADARNLGAYGSMMAVADLTTALGFAVGPAVGAFGGLGDAGSFNYLTIPLGLAAILLAIPVSLKLRKGQVLNYRAGRPRASSDAIRSPSFRGSNY